MSAESDAGYVVPPRYWTWLGRRQSLQVLLWLAALGVGVYLVWHAHTWFDSPSSIPEERRRVDGNGGHAQIDFGGQWLMGRMIVCGHARELYHRQIQWQVAQAGFRIENEPPVIQEEMLTPGPQRHLAKPDEELRHDAESLLGWFMGSDSPEWRTVGGAVAAPLALSPPGNPFLAAALQQASNDTLTREIVVKVETPAIGGPLYPPIHAFLYAPIGAIDNPQLAYQVFQVIAGLFVLVAALGIKVLTRGRIWWSVATLALFLYPGTRGGLDLGQNPTITLSIAVWGWALASRGHNILGGMVWGLFAFKPVWGLAFFLIPLLTGRWRFCAAMVFTGWGLVAATLPVVGLEAWFDWFKIGSEATRIYNVNHNWIMLSRDVQGIPRRILHDFNLPEATRDTMLARTLAWALWGSILASTVFIFLRWGDRKRDTGLGIAFLFFGSYLTCYRFMYYDALLSSLGFAVLLAEPARFFRTRVLNIFAESQTPSLEHGREWNPPRPRNHFLSPRMLGYVNSFPLTILVLLMLVENSLSGMDLQATLAFGYYAHVSSGSDGSTALVTPRVVGDTGANYPHETYLIILVWLWCAFRLMKGDEKCRPGASDGSARPIQKEILKADHETHESHEIQKTD